MQCSRTCELLVYETASSPAAHRVDGRYCEVAACSAILRSISSLLPARLPQSRPWSSSGGGDETLRAEPQRIYADDRCWPNSNAQA